jgi:hypothetical protein
MTNQHPIIPPPELIEQWVNMLSSRSDYVVFSLAAQWGADQELEACLLCLQNNDYEKIAQCLHDDRRLKPPTLKEQALALVNSNKPYLDDTAMDTIRKALEALPND